MKKKKNQSLVLGICFAVWPQVNSNMRDVELCLGSTANSTKSDLLHSLSISYDAIDQNIS